MVDKHQRICNKTHGSASLPVHLTGFMLFITEVKKVYTLCKYYFTKIDNGYISRTFSQTSILDLFR